ncbi:protein disulfide oxidoreductase [Pantoea sp. SIMBA_079]|uniref:protein disulfide oxidoreductase n=1 Tax=Pantoea sp. SIMBA_079 TaxID=3085817 RepID=UPI0039912701
MSRLKRWLREALWLLLAGVLIMLAADWLRAPQLPADLAQQPLTTLQGEQSLAGLSVSKPVLVYVWASWCGVCKLTTPVVARLSQQGVPVVSVALRSGSDAQVTQQLTKKGLQGIAVNDARGELGQRWHIAATPTFIVLYQGRVTSTTSGWSSRWGLMLRLWWAAQFSG